VVANGAEVSTVVTGTARFDSVAERLVVRGLGGADHLSAVGNVAALTQITMDGGSGDDDVRGGNGADLLLGGSGNDHVDGNQGTDTAMLGGGGDRFQWDPGDGNDTVEGQSGTDALDFNGSAIGELMEVSANGERVRFTRNIANIVMDLDGVEQIAPRPFGGADTITVGDLAGTEADVVDADLTVPGGAGDAQPDTVLADATAEADSVELVDADGRPATRGLAARTRMLAGEAQDELVVRGLDGDDEIGAGIGIPGPGTVGADGGTGADTATYEGTAGDDQIPVVANGAEVSTAVTGMARFDSVTEQLVVRGLGGADLISAVGNVAALTLITMDGGAGDDDVRGGNGADRLLGGSGDDRVDGNQGTDTALLGSGDDRFQWDPGDGNDTVEGQSGTDALDFNGSAAAELMEASANGDRLRFTRNIANIVMDVAGTERLAVRALGGNDSVTVNDLRGTGVRAADVDLAAFGGGGDPAQDTVVLNGSEARDIVRVNRTGDAVQATGLVPQSTITGSELLNDTLRINTLGGNDDVVVDPAAEELITPVIDLGADE
jgi:predicted ester cyclase